MSIASLAKSAKERKKGKTKIKASDVRMFGAEPDVSQLKASDPDYTAKFRDMTKWAHSALRPPALKRLTVQYAKENSLAEGLESLKATFFKNVGPYAWILLGKGELNETNMGWFKAELDKLVQRGKDVATVAEPTKLSPSDVARRQTSTLIAYLDGVLDDQKWDEKWREAFAGKKINLSRIKEYYKGQLDEMALIGKDPEVTHAFRLMGRKERVATQEWLSSVVAECELARTNAKASVVRRSRKRKQKTAVELTRKVTILQQDTALGIVSLSPTDIVGSKVAAVYNVKYRKIEVYTARPNGTLSIKGKTIIDFDSENSYRKNLRKPKEQLAALRTAGGIRIFSKELDSVKSKKSTAKGRLSEHHLVIKTFK